MYPGDPGQNPHSANAEGCMHLFLLTQLNFYLLASPTGIACGLLLHTHSASKQQLAAAATSDASDNEIDLLKHSARQHHKRCSRAP